MKHQKKFYMFKRRATKRTSMPRRHYVKRTIRRVYGRARGYGRRYAAGRGKFGSFFKTGKVGDVVSARGSSAILRPLTSQLPQPLNTLVELGVEYAAGGVIGMIGAEATKAFSGEPSILSNFGGLGNIFGGGGGNATSVGEMVG